jgi:hypothetical protein
MSTQGIRQTANRAGMFTTGLLSLCILVLAPVMGAKKVLKFIEPILGVLRRIPYATWLVNWLSKWWDGKVSFDELPQTESEWQDIFEHADKDDELTDALAEVREVADNITSKYEKQKAAAAQLPPEVVWFVFEKEDGKCTLMNKISKRLTTFATLQDLMIALNTMRRPNEKFLYKNMIYQNIVFDDNKGPVVIDDDDDSEDFEKEIGKFPETKSPLKTSSEIPLEDDPEESSDDDPVVLKVQPPVTTVEKVEPPPPGFDEDDGYGYIDKNGDWVSLERPADDDITCTTSFPTPEGGYVTLDPQGAEDSIKVNLLNLSDMVYEASQKCYSWLCREFWRTPEDLCDFYLGSRVKNDKVMKQSFAQFTTPFDLKDPVFKDGDGNPRVHKIDLDHLVGTTDSWTQWLSVNAVIAYNYVVEYKRPLIKGAMCLIALYVASYGASYKRLDEDITLVANPENKKGKNKHGRGGAQRGIRKGPKNGKRRFVVNSGDAAIEEQEKYQQEEERFEEPDEYDDERYDSQKYIPAKRVKTEFSKKATRGLKGQGAQEVLKVLPPVRQPSEPVLRKKIHNAKKPITAKAQDVMSFFNAVKNIHATELKIQSFNTNALSAGVYKFCEIVDGKTVYRCTGTHVGNKIWVVLHCMSENFAANYRAFNHVNTFDFKAKDMMVFGDHLACFPVNGVPSPFKTNALKVLEDASIVTVFGFGGGLECSPDSKPGFASPQGWCNSKTVDGDCTSPVLNNDGKIVGFWTHGDGKSFGRFEPVTDDLITFAKTGSSTLHLGLDFQLRPHSQ